MSHIRTGHTPDAWRDEGPATHVARGSFGIRGNTEQGYMPFVRLPIVESAAEQARKARRRETRRQDAARYRAAKA